MLVNGRPWISDNYLFQLADLAADAAPQLQKIFQAVDDACAAGDRGEHVDSPNVHVNLTALKAELLILGDFAKTAIVELEDGNED
jgi:hypothetical protein